MRMLAGWRTVRRLRKTGVCGASSEWQHRLERLRTRVRLSRPVTLLESCLADTPVVIGHFRPVILMPLGLLAGMPPAQVEAILLHELTHIRRFDYFVNLLQTWVESLLFYHPVVWWISGVIRAEREHCSDDVAVAFLADRREYAAALISLEQKRCMVGNAAPAASGGGLVNRIRRLLDQPQPPRPALTPILSLGILMTVAAVALAAWQSDSTGASQTPSSLPSLYEKWLNEDVTYIITNEEREVFQRPMTVEEREQFIGMFWARRDPTPTTVENEFKVEHYRRISYADQRFPGPLGIPGWKTDRGRTYVAWGPPDEIESHPSGGRYNRPIEEGGGSTTTFPFEKWRYRYIEGVGSDIRIEFVDRTGAGDYRATVDPHAKEVAPYDPAQSGGMVFSTAGPGAQAAVAVTPDRILLVRIPIEFDAAQYMIRGVIRSSDGRMDSVFERVASLCKHSPYEFGCLMEPVFQTGPPLVARSPLAPGGYVLEAVVKDRAGAAQKTYTVNFSVP
jgi:GWxTD domain-containing protein